MPFWLRATIAVLLVLALIVAVCSLVNAVAPDVGHWRITLTDGRTVLWSGERPEVTSDPETDTHLVTMGPLQFMAHGPVRVERLLENPNH